MQVRSHLQKMIESILVLIALIAACYTDLKEKIIPNYITIPMIVAGVIILLYNFNFFRLIIVLFSSSLIMAMWYAGVWGGGDAKLIIGIITLMSGNLFFIPAFFFSIGIVSMVHYLIFGMIHEMRNGNAKKFILFMSSIIISTYLAYLLSHQFIPFLSPIIAAAVFFIMGGMLSQHISCTSMKKIEEIEEGSMLAERICLERGNVIIKKISPSIFERFRDNCNSLTGYFADRENIEKFRKYVDEVEIFISYPMAPLILIAFILAAFFINNQ